MSIKHSYRMNRLFCSTILMGTLCTATIFAAKTEVPLFLFSGQSNMVGLGADAGGLSADQKKPVDNVKIYMDAEGDAAKKKKWLTLGPGFGGDANKFGPELFFGKILQDSMPDKKFAFIKDAVSGTYLGQTGGWMPPSSNNGTGGTLYNNMMKSIDEALKAFNTAYDTALYVPKWAGFIWHQGEFDGWQDKALADKYEVNLTNLIKDIRAKTGVDSLPIIIPMITDISTWKYASIVRTAEIAVAKKTVNADTMDTKGFTLASDNIHYNAASQIKIGTTCAIRWLKMKYLDSKVPVIAYSKSTQQIVPLSINQTVFYDLQGRRVLSPQGQAFMRACVSPSCLIGINQQQGVSKKVVAIER